MEPEYRLDALLSARERRRRAPSNVSPVDDELRPQLVVADRLSELRRAAPAPDFARSLGDRLRARADQLRQLQAQGELTLPDAPAAPAGSERRPTPIAAAWRRKASRTLRPALRPALAVAAMLLIGLGMFTYLAAQAGPGNPLYFVHRAQQDVQVQLASSQADRVRLHLNYAVEALSQLDAAAKNHDRSGYATALETLTGEAAAANQALATVPAGSDYDALTAQVAGLQAQMRHDLAADLAGLDWNNRLSTSAALGNLGVAVPHVAAATIVRQGDSSGAGSGDGSGFGGHGSAPHGDQVTISGGGFASGAALVVDGHTAKVVAIMVGPTRVVAVVADEGIEHAHSIGIVNPDGTAAQTTKITVQNPSDNGDDQHSGATPTPTGSSGATPTPTGTPGDHGGEHSP